MAPSSFSQTAARAAITGPNTLSPENAAQAAGRLVDVEIGALRHDEDRALRLREPERAKALQAGADGLGELGLEFAPVEALEGHLALVGQQDLSQFCHKNSLLR